MDYRRDPRRLAGEEGDSGGGTWWCPRRFGDRCRRRPRWGMDLQLLWAPRGHGVEHRVDHRRFCGGCHRALADAASHWDEARQTRLARADRVLHLRYGGRSTGPSPATNARVAESTIMKEGNDDANVEIRQEHCGSGLSSSLG